MYNPADVYKYSLLDIIQKLHMHKTGADNTIQDHEFTEYWEWLDDRLRKHWSQGPHYSAAYDNAVFVLAHIVREENRVEYKFLKPGE